MKNEKARFQPYEGGDPYIFASYSHDDSETVLPILDALHKRGFRVWYDQGIPWTDEWKDVVADHVKRCNLCIAFVSTKFRDSKHCKNELDYAESNNKAILLVYLGNRIKLNSGLDMYLMPYQSVKWSDFPCMSAFLDEMERQTATSLCKSDAASDCSEELETNAQNDSVPWSYDGKIKWYLDDCGVLKIAPIYKGFNEEIPNYYTDSTNKTNRSTAPWMQNNRRRLISEVLIEDGITAVGNCAFWNCTNLKKVSIPESVHKIGSCAFYCCKSLSDITITGNMSEIGESAFSFCVSLFRVIILGNVERVSAKAFSGCTGLSFLEIPGSLFRIDDMAFENTSLKSIIIPDSVKMIGHCAFSSGFYCLKLENVSIPSGVQFYGDSFPSGAKITIYT